MTPGDSPILSVAMPCKQRHQEDHRVDIPHRVDVLLCRGLDDRRRTHMKNG